MRVQPGFSRYQAPLVESFEGVLDNINGRGTAGVKFEAPGKVVE